MACKKKIADFDACSLYPSAMNRMLGYLKGTPKVLQQNMLNYDFLKKQDGYFIRVKILKVGKYLQFPLLSKINEKTGVRDFSNDMVGETVYIDKTCLEDIITFQKMEFEIIDGYYFDEGRNDTIKHVIKYFYDLRKTVETRKKTSANSY